MVSSKKKKLYAAVNDSYGRTKSFIKHLNQCSAHKHKRRQYLQSHFNLFAHRENAESLLNSPYVARDSLLCSNHKSELQLLDVWWLAELKHMQQERPAAPASDHVALENVVWEALRQPLFVFFPRKGLRKFSVTSVQHCDDDIQSDEIHEQILESA